MKISRDFINDDDYIRIFPMPARHCCIYMKECHESFDSTPYSHLWDSTHVETRSYLFIRLPCHVTEYLDKLMLLEI